MRNVISATNPRRFRDSYTEIVLKVWFEEGGPFEFIASPFDTERHGKALWIRAMAGEFGPIEVLSHRLDGRAPRIFIDLHNETHLALVAPTSTKQLAAPVTVPQLPAPPKLLEYHHEQSRS